jgi:NAD-dependent DNA ligase
MKEFLDTFEKSKDQTCQEIIGNFGIPYIGIKTLEKIGVEDLNDLIKYKDIKYLRSDKVVEVKLCEWLNQDEKNFDDLFSLVKFIKPKDKKVDNRKYTFCITGEFVGKRRAKAIEEIENECSKWKFVSSVTKETDILIKGQEGGMSNKEISAVKYKIPILVLDGQYDINKIKEKLKEME